jgi:uncharacterized protein (DUF433 family)
LTGVSYRRVRAWFCGEREQGQGLIQGDFGTAGLPGGLISFHDLIDTLVVGKLRERGLSLQYLRRVHAGLLREFEVSHPFCWKRLLTDGKRVFVHVADELGHEEYLRELLSRQRAFCEVLLPVLESIDYDSRSLLARRWNIADGVIVDPCRQRGKPIIEAAGIPTAVIAAAFEANGQDVRTVAHWYGIADREVKRAVAFESGLGRSAA